MILVELPIAVHEPPMIVAIATGIRKARTGRSRVRHHPSTIGIMRLTSAVLLTNAPRIKQVMTRRSKPKKIDFELPMMTLSSWSSALV